MSLNRIHQRQVQRFTFILGGCWKGTKVHIGERKYSDKAQNYITWILLFLSRLTNILTNFSISTDFVRSEAVLRKLRLLNLLSDIVECKLVFTIFKVKKLGSQAALLSDIVNAILHSRKSSLKTCLKVFINLANLSKQLDFSMPRLTFCSKVLFAWCSSWLRSCTSVSYPFASTCKTTLSRKWTY